MTLLVNPVVFPGFSDHEGFSMPRPNKPWFRAQTGWWMVKLGGKQHKLVQGRKNKKDAITKFHELMSTQAQLPESPDARVADICEAFLGFSAKNHAPDTYRNHRYYLQEFSEAAGQVLVSSLRVLVRSSSGIVGARWKLSIDDAVPFLVIIAA